MGRSKVCGIGTSFDAKHWLSLDPCGFFGISLSWGVHLYALVTIFLLLLSNSNVSLVLFAFGYLPCSVLAMISLYMASTTNPGAVPMGARPLVTVRPSQSAATSNGGSHASASSSRNRPMRRCHKCNDNFKPARAHHDSVTGRCIVKFDHYCPWVNNSIGALNHKFFCLFLFYTAVCCLMSLFLLAMRAYQCSNLVPEHAEQVASHGAADSVSQADRVTPDERLLLATLGLSPPNHLLYAECSHFYDNYYIWALAGSSILFFLFTSVMSCEQLDAIATGRSKIARMKVGVGQGGTEYVCVSEEFNEMFGGDSPKPSWHWYLPMQVVFPRGMKKVVLGYDWDETFDAAPYRDADDEEEDESSSQQLDDDNDEESGLQMTAALSLPQQPRRKSMGSRETSTGSVHSLSADGLNRRRHDSGDSRLQIV